MFIAKKHYLLNLDTVCFIRIEQTDNTEYKLVAHTHEFLEFIIVTGTLDDCKSMKTLIERRLGMNIIQIDNDSDVTELELRNDRINHPDSYIA